MFDRWVHKTNININKKKISTSFASLQRMDDIKRIATATRELMETIRVNWKVTIHEATTITKIAGNELARTPAPVATPLPPLKPKKGENTCPSIAEAPIIRISNFEECATAVLSKIKTGKNPFRKSAKKTITPIFFPSTRQALVAPTFPLPCRRISTPFILLAIRAKGIEPQKKLVTKPENSISVSFIVYEPPLNNVPPILTY